MHQDPRSLNFRVWPSNGERLRYYSNLYHIRNDFFNRNELDGATIAVVFNGTVVGYLNTENVLDEVYA